MDRVHLHWGRQSKFTVLILLLVLLNMIIMYSHVQLQDPPDKHYLPLELEEQIMHHLPKDVENLRLTGTTTTSTTAAKKDSDTLVIGISTVTRKRSSYLLDTLDSLFTHMRTTTSDVLVTVFLADQDPSARANLTKLIFSRFQGHIEADKLWLFQALDDIYPSFDNITPTYGDAKDRLVWRAKQALDFAYLWSSVKHLGRYYLHLEDDVLSSPGFVEDIRKGIKRLKGYSGKWVCIEYSRLGFIGKLYRTRDLGKMADFVRTFYDRHPVDFLMRYFIELMGQKTVILHEPSLFQHIGVNSSLEGKIQPLRDKGFAYKTKQGDHENPPASLLTTIKQIKQFGVDLSYSKSPGYFWGHPPKEGDVIWILFDEPTKVKDIKITTGSDKYEKDYLKSGLIEGSTDVLQYSDDPKTVKCSNLIYIGAFDKGQLHITDLDKSLDVDLQCLRISVIQGQKNWLLIEEINIR